MNNNNDYGEGPKPPKQGRNFALVLIIILIALSFVWIMNKDNRNIRTITYSKFLNWTHGWYQFKQEDSGRVHQGKLVKYDKENKIYILESNGKIYKAKEVKEIARVTKVKIVGKEITGSYIRDNTAIKKFTTYIPYNDAKLLALLREKNIEIIGEPPSNNYFLQILTTIIPWILIFGVLWFVMFRQIQGSGNKALSFG